MRAALDGKLASGEWLTQAQAEEKTQKAIAQKVADKELITAETLRKMALREPIVEVKGGKAEVRISLQTASSLGEAWKAVFLEEHAASVKEGALQVVVPAEAKAAFYRFVVPENQ